MSDDRALAWCHLLPTGVRFAPIGGPEWWRTLLREISIPDGALVPVVWGDSTPSDWAETNLGGLVLVNPGADALDKFRVQRFATVRHFAVLPRLSDARWFVPLNSRRLAAAALRLYTPYRWKARAAHLGTRIATRLGVFPRSQDTVLIASRERSSIEQLLHDALGEEPSALAISTGTPSPSRKVTMAAIDRAGKFRAVCKLATSPLASRLVENEAACLSVLARRTDLAPHCPRLIIERKLESGRAIVTEGIGGRRAGAQLGTLHRQLLTALASGSPRPATVSHLFSHLFARVRALPQRGIPALSLLEWAGRTLEGLVLPQTIVHGDFAPWNLRVCHDKLMAFDWEYGQCDGLPLLDEVHHLVQVGFLVHNWSPSGALEEMKRQAAAGRPGLNQEQIRALQAVYLLDAYLRRKEESHPANDALLARLAELMTRLAISAGVRIA